MITIISGTNREDSNTLKISQHYFQTLNDRGEDVHLVSLKDKPVHYRSDELIAIEEQLLIPCERFIFILPEYNGSYPGILKTMIDNTDIRKTWWHKKALLVGLATGRGGNARGLDHLSNILHYLKVNVHYNKLPISKVHEEIGENGKFINEKTVHQIEEQLNEFLKF